MQLSNSILYMDTRFLEDWQRIRSYHSLLPQEILERRKQATSLVKKLSTGVAAMETTRRAHRHPDLAGNRINISFFRALIKEIETQGHFIPDTKLLDELEFGFSIRGKAIESGYWRTLQKPALPQEIKKFKQRTAASLLKNFTKKELQEMENKVNKEIEEGAYKELPLHFNTADKIFISNFPITTTKTRVVSNAKPINIFQELPEKTHLPAIPRLLNIIRLFQLPLLDLNNNPIRAQELSRRQLNNQIQLTAAKTKAGHTQPDFLTYSNEYFARKRGALLTSECFPENLELPRFPLGNSVAIGTSPHIAAWSIDLKNAFRQLPLQPHDPLYIKSYCISTNSFKLLKSNSLVMGCKNSVHHFQRTSNLICHISAFLAWHNTLPYIDDHNNFENSFLINSSFTFHQTLLEALGFEISVEKSATFTSPFTMLGLQFHLNTSPILLSPKSR